MSCLIIPASLSDGLWAPQFNSNLDIGLKQEEDMDYHDWRDLRDISYEEFDHVRNATY